MILTPGILLSYMRYNLSNTELLDIGHSHNRASEGLLSVRKLQLAQFLSPAPRTHTPESLHLELLSLGTLASFLHCSLHHLYAFLYNPPQSYSHSTML